MAHVVIMVPSFGKGAENFYQAALGLKRDFYGPNTTIVKVRAVLPKDWWNLEEMLDLWELIGEKDRAEVIKRLKNYKGRVEHPLILRTDKGKPFHFGEPKSCRSFITLSHAAEGDGPIFYDHHKTHGFQPWGRMPRKDNPVVLPIPHRWDVLSPQGQTFWGQVGRAVADDGKIMVFGCNTGASTYIDKVAAASGRKTFGLATDSRAGDRTTVLGWVKKIEGNFPAQNMRETDPTTGRARMAEHSKTMTDPPPVQIPLQE